MLYTLLFTFDSLRFLNTSVTETFDLLLVFMVIDEAEALFETIFPASLCSKRTGAVSVGCVQQAACPPVVCC